MTDARQLAIFVDCPYDGCEQGYCACLEQDIDEDLLAEFYDDWDPPELNEETRQALADLSAGRAAIYRGRVRPLETLPDIATYTPEGTRL